MRPSELPSWTTLAVLAGALSQLACAFASAPAPPARLHHDSQARQVGSYQEQQLLARDRPSQHLLRRAASDPSTSTSPASPPPPPSSAASSPSDEITFVMPQAFDAILGVNFSTPSCPSFFSSFLADEAFSSCAPLSFLLGTSTSFFKAMQNSTILPLVMDEICSADENACSGVMDRYASEMVQEGNCRKDLAQGNALAVAAYTAFQSYRTYYEAGCLKADPAASPSQYCFAEAANATSASDMYLYYLPSGTSLPSGTHPTCSTCSRAVMAVFSDFATNATLPLAQTYVAARSTLSVSCGPAFAPLVAATAASQRSAAAARTGAPLATLASAAAVLLLAALTLA